MARRMTLTKEIDEEISLLADTLGYTREQAALYAVRLVNACIREGLLTDVPGRAWPQAAHRESVHAERGKVLAFRCKG